MTCSRDRDPSIAREEFRMLFAEPSPLRFSRVRAPGGFPTASGMADGTPVHWIVGGENTADSLEKKFGVSSRLLKLMVRNAYTVEGLSETEHAEAVRLIDSEPLCDDRPCFCKAASVGDTGMCRAHNEYALRTRK